MISSRTAALRPEGKEGVERVDYLLITLQEVIILLPV